MSIECAFYGFLAADAEPRTSQAGKPWVRMRVGVGKDESVQWVQVAVFGKAVEKAAALKLDTWRGNDGVERHGLSVATFKCEPMHRIGRNRPDQKQKERDFGSAPTGAPFDDEITFAPEWRG
jgi:hypothetical protein